MIDASDADKYLRFWGLTWAVWNSDGLAYTGLDYKGELKSIGDGFSTFYVKLNTDSFWKWFVKSFSPQEHEFAIMGEVAIRSRPDFFLTSSRLVLWNKSKAIYVEFSLQHILEYSIKRGILGDTAHIRMSDGESFEIRMGSCPEEYRVWGAMAHAKQVPPWRTTLQGAKMFIARVGTPDELRDILTFDTLELESMTKPESESGFASSPTTENQSRKLGAPFGSEEHKPWSTTRKVVWGIASVIIFVGLLRQFGTEEPFMIGVFALFALAGGGAAAEMFSNTWESD